MEWKISLVDWARLAAYIDAEGTIWISIYRWKNPKNLRTYTGFRMEITVANTDPRLILWIRETFGGWLSVERQKGVRRPCFKWRIAAIKASTILKNCLPYFLIKDKEARIAIAFQQTMSKGNARKGVPKKILAWRYELKAELSRLKHRKHETPSEFIN